MPRPAPRLAPPAPPACLNAACVCAGKSSPIKSRWRVPFSVACIQFVVAVVLFGCWSREAASRPRVPPYCPPRLIVFAVAGDQARAGPRSADEPFISGGIRRAPICFIFLSGHFIRLFGSALVSSLSGAPLREVEKKLKIKKVTFIEVFIEIGPAGVDGRDGQRVCLPSRSR